MRTARGLLPLVWLAAGCATPSPSLYGSAEPIIPGSMCLTLLERDGLGLPTAREHHQPAAVRIALPRRLERLSTIDLLRLGVPAGIFLDASARLAPYTASSGALMPLNGPAESSHLHAGQEKDPHETQFLKELSELMSRNFASEQGGSAIISQGLTVSPIINTFSGNLFACSLDAAALWKGLNVMVYRLYNGLMRTPGPFGTGWTHNFAARLDFNEDQSIQYTRWDGSRFCYRPDGKGGYQSPDGFQDALTRSGTGFVLEDGNGFALAFDGTGRLAQLANRLGYRIVLGYQGDRLTSIRNLGTVIRITGSQEKPEFVEGGPGVSLLYDDQGRITEIRSTSGTQMHYGYGADGRLARVTSNIQQTVEYRYDEQGRLVEVRDPKVVSGRGAVSAVFRYDDRDRVQEVTDGQGNTTMRLFYRWAEDRTTQVELGTQHAVVTDRYDPRGVLEERVEQEQSLDPMKPVTGGGKTQRRETDIQLNVTFLSRTDGSNSRWTYDGKGRLIRAQDSSGAWVEMTYDGTTGRVDYIRESGSGRWIRFLYEINGDIHEVVTDQGLHFRVEYDDGGIPRGLVAADGELFPLSLGFPEELPKQLWEF